MFRFTLQELVLFALALLCVGYMILLAYQGRFDEAIKWLRDNLL